MSSGRLTRQPEKCFCASFGGQAHSGEVAIFPFPLCYIEKPEQARRRGLIVIWPWAPNLHHWRCGFLSNSFGSESYPFMLTIKRHIVFLLSQEFSSQAWAVLYCIAYGKGPSKLLLDTVVRKFARIACLFFRFRRWNGWKRFASVRYVSVRAVQALFTKERLSYWKEMQWKVPSILFRKL